MRNLMKFLICILVSASIYLTFSIFNSSFDAFEWNLFSRIVGGFIIGHYLYYNLDDIYDNI